MGPVNVRVRLFAVLRERAGSDSVEIELAEDATVADALERLAASPPLAELLERMPVRLAVNRSYADAATRLAPGDELALIPPISGGAPGAAEPHPGPTEPHVRVTEEPLSLEALAAAVGRPEAGAVVTFQGVTREVARLDYEAYGEMAAERIAAILRDCIDRHGLEAAAAEHRVGSVALGEPSVIVAVSAAHRGEAFAGAREAIDRIKAEAPIWKREVEGDGAARWVEGAQPPLDPVAQVDPAPQADSAAPPTDRSAPEPAR
jgi:molybdopterin converting factor subunit 1